MRSSRGVPCRVTVIGACGVAGPLKGFARDARVGATPAEQSDHYVAELRKILPRFGMRRRLPKGASLHDPSDRARHLYIVARGLVEAFLPEALGRLPVASFHTGARFSFACGAHPMARCEAAADSRVIDLPYARLRVLCPDETDLRLLLQQVHAFDLEAFLDVCYPARDRIRLAPRSEGTPRAQQ